LDLIAQFFNVFNRASATAINPFFGTSAVALPGFGRPIQDIAPGKSSSPQTSSTRKRPAGR
jgi:hypothetical protein